MNYSTTKYELFKEKFEITEWRNGSVFNTKFVEENWFPMELVDSNVPQETNIIYANSNRIDIGIRRAKSQVE